MAVFFSLLSSATIITVYSIYFAKVRRGASTPNPSTWTVWLVVNILNSVTYLAAVQNVWKGLITIVVSVGVLMIFGYSLIHGKFTKMGWIEIFSFAVAIGAGLFWKLSGDPRIANLALQGVFAVSYVPTLTGVARGYAKEHPLPWALAVVAYLFASATILIDWNGEWVALAYPAVNGVLGNGSVALLSFLKRTRC